MTILQYFIILEYKEKVRICAMEYMCNICGYTYDGTDFTKEPDDYQCPLCDCGKDEFRPRKIDVEVQAATNEYHKIIK